MEDTRYTVMVVKSQDIGSNAVRRSAQLAQRQDTLPGEEGR
jgi:hypothetical protein